MNRQRTLLYALVALVTVAIFGFLLFQAQRINEDVHNQYRSDLGQIESLNAILNENVLRAKLGLLTYYDPLNNTLNSIDQVRGRLDHIPSFISDQGQKELGDSLKAYDSLLAKQKDLVWQFETQNSVLKNSLSYFTIVVSDLAGKATQADIDPTIKGALNSLLQDILLYNTSADQTLIPRIQADLALVQQNKDQLSSGAIALDVDVLTSHTNIVIQRKPIIDSVLGQMFALPMTKQIADQSALYDTGFEAARQSTNFFQIMLYVFSLLAVVCIAALIIIRLRSSAEELQVLNNELGIATQQAREASRLKDEFLAVMSHELRTPLNAIIGFQGILLMTETLTERASHRLRRAQANAERLLALINDILDISRIESGRLQLTPINVTIAKAVDTWRNQMSVLAEEKGLNFSVCVDETVPPTVHVDEDAVTKIVTNLLGNAFKFTEKGEVALNLKRSNGNWIIEVSDTGIGIPAHKQDIIFERFRQVDGSTTRKYGGSGLGLAIVHNLCKAMNGTVTVQSVPEKGSTFTVTLPLEVPVQEGQSHE